MQPVKISILGDYVDCQIYRGRLYLWTFEGSLKTLLWNEIVSSLAKNERDRLPLRFCFLDGNHLYKPDILDLLTDEDFKQLLMEKFEGISNQDYCLDEKEVDRHLFGEQGAPENNIPTDTEIYNSRLYYITEDGLFSATAHTSSKKYPVGHKSKKHWDCNLLSIKANKYPQLALSGGSEGLFELDLYGLNSKTKSREPNHLSRNHSSFANYTFWSLYNSSLVDNSYLAMFDLQRVQTETSPLDAFSFEKPKFQRSYKAEIGENEIFETKHNAKYLSWGVDDKIYRATSEGFEIVKFRNKPNADKGEGHFTHVQNLALRQWKGKVIGGGVSYFGTIVECENALVVMLSDGDVITVRGPITRWRIYPRSINYQNHLHVIKEDRIEIYSFNQDFFLAQNEKLMGLEHKEPWSWAKNFR